MIRVVINVQHKLLPDQLFKLNQKFGEGNWSRLDVPADGWTADEQRRQIELLSDVDLVFASPLPLMLLLATREAALGRKSCFVMHNDKRDKQEKDGRVFYTVASDGWEILES